MGVVNSYGVHRRVSVDVRAGVTVNALQTFRKSNDKQMGRTGRTDEGDHITMMSHSQFVEQICVQDVAQLGKSDSTPMIL